MDKPLPILVIGAGRGGTSLLAACMSGHAQIDMQLEFGGVALLMGRELQVGDPRRMLAERLAAFRAACDAQRAASALPIRSGPWRLAPARAYG